MPGRAEFERDVLAVRDRLHAAALKLTFGARAEADDLVQDTIERALRSWTRYSSDRDLATWLVTILHRLFIDRLRRRKVRNEITSVPVEVAAIPEEEESPWARISADEVWRAVDQLGAEERAVFRLFEGERRSYEEIAALLGIPRNTVGTRLLRARQRLRRILIERVPLEA